MKKIQLIIPLLFSIFLITCDSKINNTGTKIIQPTTKYTELKTIISEEVGDTFYIYIRVPKNYSLSNNTYPVLYLLDGDISFNMATSIIRYMQYGSYLPDLIIVGIGYGTMMSDEEKNFRERDYSISHIDQLPISGKGENFLKFIKNELIPFVEKEYRVNSDKTLSGFSLGGLFTIYTLLNEPELFKSYIAGSPYLFKDINLLIKMQGIINFQEKKKLFISLGEQETIEEYFSPVGKLMERLNNKSNIQTKFEIFKNGTHFTTPSEALVYGLKFIFNE